MPPPHTPFNATTLAMLALGGGVSLVLLQRWRKRTRFPSKCKLVGLFIYPVKGFQAIQLEESHCLAKGFQYDRRFMVVDAEGNFKTQRELAQMATVKCEILNGGTDCPELRLSTKDGKSSVVIKDWAQPQKARKTVRVWRSIVDNAVDQGEEASKFVSQALGVDGLRLVFMDENDTARLCNEEVVPNAQVSFADGYPVLVASVSSLADLNKRIGGETIPMERFRPNIVLDGLYPWTEDYDGTVFEFANGQKLRTLKPCDRCKVTTTDQQLGVVQPSGEPLKTMRKFRKIKDTVDVYFATNCIADKPATKPISMLNNVVKIKWFG